jgi:hypothetical protein
MIECPKAGDYLVLSHCPSWYLSVDPLFEIPVFFEPLVPEAIERVGQWASRIAIVLDGDQPSGREWIKRIRKHCHMVERNTMHFGERPYYYAFPGHNRVGADIQYLVFTQGESEPAARWRIALAMLRQWDAERVTPHALALIEPKYFVEDAVPISLVRSSSA